MSATSTIQNITDEALKYTPSIINTVLAVESVAGQLPGATKLELALGAIQAGSAEATKIPNNTVAGIASLVNLFVTILNITGVFKKKS